MVQRERTACESEWSASLLFHYRTPIANRMSHNIESGLQCMESICLNSRTAQHSSVLEVVVTSVCAACFPHALHSTIHEKRGWNDGH